MAPFQHRYRRCPRGVRVADSAVKITWHDQHRNRGAGPATRTGAKFSGKLRGFRRPCGTWAWAGVNRRPVRPSHRMRIRINHPADRSTSTSTPAGQTAARPEKPSAGTRRPSPARTRALQRVL